MYGIDDHEEMDADDRLKEVAYLMATGFLRLKKQGDPEESGESCRV